MPFELPPACQDLTRDQAHVIAAWQAPGVGLDHVTRNNRLRYGHWQRLQRGVYTTYTGNPTREAQLWGALLRAGPDAVLSHYSAAERHGLLSQPSTAIHVTVPKSRDPARKGKIPGVVIHRSDLGLARRERFPRRYLDNLYEGYSLCVELDGTAAHPADEQWRDKRRDRWNVVHQKIVTLRIGFIDLLDEQRQCETAAQIATALSDRGPAVGTPCRRAACPLRSR